jgi:F0F1-type ATP synthase assembly protein I
METGPKKGSLPDTVRTLGALSTVGFSFVLAVVIGAGLGVFLMRQYGLGSWVFFLFFLCGLAAGVLNVYRAAGKFLK